MNFQHRCVRSNFFVRGLVLLACVAVAQPVMAGWSEKQKIISTPPGVGAEFGNAIAISGNTMVVGAHNTAPNQEGAAFVYELNGTTWTQKAKLVAGVIAGISPAATDHFGYSVAISGDTIVVGAPSTFGSLTNPGSVYVFVRNGMTWVEQKKLTGGMAGDEFGQSVAIQGETLVVGAHLVDFPIPNMVNQFWSDAGSAYIFRRSGTVWMQTQQLKPTLSAVPNPSPILGDLFGSSVAISGNFIAVGAEGDDMPLTRAGTVYVFAKNSVGTYVQQPKLFVGGGGNGDRLGYSVALEGNTLVAGAPYYTPHTGPPLYTQNSGETHRGAAYVFEFNGATWALPKKLVASDGLLGDHFGWSVAVSSNVIAVGARDDDMAAGQDAGSTYVFTQSFSQSVSVWTESQKLAPSSPFNGDRFGESVAWSFGNLVVGAALKPLNPGQGAAYYFVPVGSIWWVGFGIIALVVLIAIMMRGTIGRLFPRRDP